MTAVTTFLPVYRAFVSLSAVRKYVLSLCFTVLKIGNVPPLVPTTVIRYRRGCRPLFACGGKDEDVDASGRGGAQMKNA